KRFETSEKHSNMSVSVTRTFLKKNEVNKGFRQQRTYDYLYDPVYTLAADVDHTRENLRAQASVERVRKVPEFSSMFSNLPHHPSFTLCLEASDPVPAFIDRRWPGFTEQRRLTLQRLTRVFPEAKGSTDVTGADRWKFFKRPLLPFAQQIPPDVVYALPKSDVFFADGDGKHTTTPFQRNVGVQTDYRDSEAQTDPYSPHHTLAPGMASPELLTLASLRWGHGLPAGLTEVEMIWRARKKRAFEATMPPLNDLSQLEKRRRMMEEMERKELQEARLNLLVELLRQREEKQDEVKSKQLDISFSQHQEEKERRIIQIRKEYNSEMRKLLVKRKNVEGKLERRDIVKDYADYSSQTYAPLARNGQILEQTSKRSPVKTHFLSSYQGLLDLEADFSPSVLEPQVKVPKPKGSKSFISRSERLNMELTRTHQVLKERKLQKEDKKPLRFLFRKEKPIPRPPSPIVETPPKGEEEKELAIIFLQKLLRGRSIQNQVFEAKEKHVELIQELRTTHALQKEEQDKKEEEKQVTLALQRQREQQNDRVSQTESFMSGLSGGVIADMLDFLSKELVRLQEERRIHAFSLLAERDRRIREAEEKDVILASINQTADTQARQEVHRMAEDLNNMSYALEETRTSQQSEEIVAELVYRFLIPEVQKMEFRERVRHSQKRHLQAARSVLSQGRGFSALSESPHRASSAVPHNILGQTEEAIPRNITPGDLEPTQNNLTRDPPADTNGSDGIGQVIP
ncbi:hypothetical protein DNTS_028778, partial [Danionella cerebrum]